MLTWKNKLPSSCTSFSPISPTGKLQSGFNTVVIQSLGPNHSCTGIIMLTFACRCFNSILVAVTSPGFYNTYVQLPTEDTPLQTYISNNPKFFPFFEGALGALDGNHILAHPCVQDCVHYCNHESGVSQNVIAACTFDMYFCYILSGWE